MSRTLPHPKFEAVGAALVLNHGEFSEPIAEFNSAAFASAVADALNEAWLSSDIVPGGIAWLLGLL